MHNMTLIRLQHQLCTSPALPARVVLHHHRPPPCPQLRHRPPTPRCPSRSDRAMKVGQIRWSGQGVVQSISGSGLRTCLVRAQDLCRRSQRSLFQRAKDQIRLDLWGVLSSGGLNEIDSRKRTEYCRDRKKYVSSVS